VLFFFVLSGFVPSLPFLGDRSDPYLAYLIKRVRRIWIPYAVAILGALAARLTLGDLPTPSGMTEWYQGIWGSR
jgi:peptidoglycan/LPS O-acetylase OafA/YrhL